MSRHELPVGDPVRVRFRLGATGGPGGRYEARGVIAGSRRQGQGWRIGVQFTEVPGRVSAEIADYVAGQNPNAVPSRLPTGGSSPISTASVSGTINLGGSAEPARPQAPPKPERPKPERPKPALTFVARERAVARPQPAEPAREPITVVDHDAPIDYETLNLYLDALRGSRLPE